LSGITVNHHGMTTNNQPTPPATPSPYSTLNSMDLSQLYGSPKALPTFGTAGYIPKNGYSLPIFRRIDNLVGKVISKVSNTLNAVDSAIANHPVVRKFIEIPADNQVTYMLNKKVVEAAVKSSMIRQRQITLCEKDLESGQKLKFELTAAKVAKLQESIADLEARHKKLVSAQSCE